MMSYTFDDTPFMTYLGTVSLNPHERSVMLAKISEIKSAANPKSLGGAYRNKWLYPVGVFQIVAEINSTTLTVIFEKFIRLP